MNFDTADSAYHKRVVALTAFASGGSDLGAERVAAPIPSVFSIAIAKQPGRVFDGEAAVGIGDDGGIVERGATFALITPIPTPRPL